jgi:probable phosphoglycerate mutase
MNVYFLRHGFALHNQEYKKKGISAYLDINLTDPELVEIGKEQAKKAGEVLKDIEFDYIYCSPLLRCIQTANLAKPDKDILLDDLIIEPQGKHFCNRRKDKIFLKEILKKRFNNTFNIDNVKEKYNFEMENKDEINYRTKLFLNKLNILKNEGVKNVLVVTHHDFVNYFFKFNYGIKCSLINCEIKQILI